MISSFLEITKTNSFTNERFEREMLSLTEPEEVPTDNKVNVDLQSSEPSSPPNIVEKKDAVIPPPQKPYLPRPQSQLRPPPHMAPPPRPPFMNGHQSRPPVRMLPPPRPPMNGPMMNNQFQNRPVNIILFSFLLNLINSLICYI